MAKILIAASSEPSAIVQRILDGHRLVCAGDMVAADAMLEAESFDLIVCTIAFDESRMFDLLRRASTLPRSKTTPFVCARVRPNIIRTAAVLDGIAMTSRELGAAAFLDIAKFSAAPEKEMRAAIESFLPAA